jgi:cyclopropane-fatty-acyl-phospholipid synthase
MMDEGPIAVATAAANDQHYEVPAEFFRLVLGPHLKYSCCLWPDGVDSLAEAEAAMLALTCERAGIEDGMRILDLGCGWGSLAVWLAEHYPASQVLAVSNSHGQRAFIIERARAKGLLNLEVRTADLNDFAPAERFDRIVSVEMFEHMRNYRRLLARVASWLTPRGRLFLHVFCHREHPYFFEDKGPSDWMTRHFFTGGLMPTEDLLARVQDDLEICDRWRVDGRHYEKTLLAWLARLDAERDRVEELFAEVYGGPQEALIWRNRWRIFFLACAELFGFRGGSEWLVSHTLWQPRRTRRISDS